MIVAGLKGLGKFWLNAKIFCISTETAASCEYLNAPLPTPPNFNFPVRVNVMAALVPAASEVTLPETITVLLLIVISFAVATDWLDVNAMLPAFNVPVPTAMRFLKEVFALIIVIQPETVRVCPELMDMVLLAVCWENVKVAQAALAETVILYLPVRITSSPATGTWLGVQLPAEFQVPVALDVMVVAIAIALSVTISTIVRMQNVYFFMLLT
jgi:hypothetical protein